MKKLIIALACAATSISSAGVALAAGGTPKPVFSCQIGTKTVRIEAVNDKLIYHYGVGDRDEMMIIGDMHSGNPKYSYSPHLDFSQTQVRFKNGQYSYIVYVDDAKDTEMNAAAGLMVLKGKTKISDKDCTTPATFGVDLSGLPLDDDEYSAEHF